MRIQLRGTPPSFEQQKIHNAVNNYWIVLVVLTILLLYVYLYSGITAILHLPDPSKILSSTGFHLSDMFRNIRNLGCALHIQYTQIFNEHDERLVLFMMIIFAFLCGYFLPVKYKKVSHVVWFLLGFGILYGLTTTLIFLSSHLLIYISLHHKSNNVFAVRELLSLIVFSVFYRTLETSPGMILLISFLVGISVFVFLQYVLDPLIKRGTRWTKLYQTLIVQSPILLAVVGAIFEGITHVEWGFPIGILFLFWQWERLIVYHLDYRNDEIPASITLTEYLSVFMTPATISNNRYAPYVGQGYSYLAGCFYNSNKNKIVLQGVKLLSLALIYFLFNEWILRQIRQFFLHQFGVVVYESIYQLVRMYVKGLPTSTATVLTTTFLDQVRIFFIYGAVTHFRVGTWRLLGYNMDPQYNKPWKATNLVSLWSRFAYHYREFLVRAFYYPVFFRFFKEKPYLRTFTATMVATAVGNLFWGHIPDHLYYRGITWNNLILLLRGWPYYVLLGLGISLTQVFLMKHKSKRRSWTLDRYIPRDIVFAYLTFQFFSLIHVFGRTTPDSTIMDHVRLFFIGLGIHI